MIVRGGGTPPDGKRWVSCRPGFFLPVRVLSRLFRRLFLEKLVAAHAVGRLSFFGDHVHLADAQSFAAFLAPLRKAKWVVYAKRPFGGPETVLAYLSRYTHRVAIANGRHQDRHLMTAPQYRKSAHRVRWLSTSHRRARSDIRRSAQIGQVPTAFDANQRRFIHRFALVQLPQSRRPQSATALAALKSP